MLSVSECLLSIEISVKRVHIIWDNVVDSKQKKHVTKNCNQSTRKCEMNDAEAPKKKNTKQNQNNINENVKICFTFRMTIQSVSCFWFVFITHHYFASQIATIFSFIHLMLMLIVKFYILIVVVTNTIFFPVYSFLVWFIGMVTHFEDFISAYSLAFKWQRVYIHIENKKKIDRKNSTHQSFIIDNTSRVQCAMVLFLISSQKYQQFLV